MDVSNTIAPTSDQLDAVDLLSGPRTFTITEVIAGNAEQPVQVRLAEFPRVWRPGKSMRRVLVAAWGPDASTWIGRRVTLYCDPDVRFGGDKVGGTRISHMTDLPGGKRLSVPLLVTRGKSAMFTVEPLTDAPRAPKQTAPDIATITDRDVLREMYRATPNSDRARQDAIKARVAELDAAPPTDADWPDVATPGGEA